MIKKRSLLKCVCGSLGFMFQMLTINAQPINLPIESRPDLFAYFSPVATNSPLKAADVSKAIIHLNSFIDEWTPGTGAKASAFLIHTFRDDNKICMCLSGHQVKTLFTNGSPIVGSPAPFNSDIYMDYLGEDEIVNGEYQNKTINFSKAFLSSVTLLAYEGDVQGGKDAALVLIDKNQLPSALIGTLGYDFDDNNWASSGYYCIGHPNNYPQRIADNLAFQQDQVFSVQLSGRLPYAVGFGNSGAPLLTRPVGVAGTVKGIFSQASGYQNFLGHLKSDFSTNYFQYATTSYFTKMSVLEAAIRNHCWKKSDSTRISVNGSYKQTISVDNSNVVNAYSRYFTLSSASSLTQSSSSLFSESSSDEEYSRLNANNCSVGDFSLPTTYPGGSKSWRVTIAAQKINVFSGFSYAASGSAELELSAVVIGSSAARQTNSQSPVMPEENNALFEVYPNPSSSGIYHLKLPAGGTFLVVVNSLEGREIYRASCNANPFTLQLPQIARGTYVLNVYTKEDLLLRSSRLIIY